MEDFDDNLFDEVVMNSELIMNTKAARLVTQYNNIINTISLEPDISTSVGEYTLTLSR